MRRFRIQLLLNAPIVCTVTTVHVLFVTSVKTVESHVSAVLRKRQLSSCHELTAWALARRPL